MGRLIKGRHRAAKGGSPVRAKGGRGKHKINSALDAYPLGDEGEWTVSRHRAKINHIVLRESPSEASEHRC